MSTVDYTPSNEKWGRVAVAFVACLAAGWVGSTYVKRPATLELVDGRTTVASNETMPTQGLLSSGGSLGAGAAPASEPAVREVTVHVVGAVRQPGLYVFPSGARVKDAIAKAGGAFSNADLESINLAAKLEDGSQLDVPKKGAAPTPESGTASPYAGAKSGSNAYARKPKAGATSSGPVSLNTASAAELDRLPGVGPATAKKIIEYRMAHGGFSSIEEVMKVKGIGPKKFADMKPMLRL